MGAIQGSINALLGTAGKAAILDKAMDIIGGQQLATESISGVQKSAEEHYQKSLKLKEEAQTATEAEKDIYQEEHGLSDEEMQMLTDDEMSSITAVGTATNKMAVEEARIYKQKEALAQRLKDISEGRNKVGKRQLKKELQEEQQ